MKLIIFFVFLSIKTIFSEVYSLNDKNKFICNNSVVDCDGHGVCSKDKEECICFEGYQTYFKNVDSYMNNSPRCNYKSKLQLYALLLTIFISFGSPHFYMGNYIIGIIQLSIFTFIFFFNIFFISKLSLKHLKKLNRNEIKESLNILIFIILFIFIFMFWYIFDLIMIYNNYYKDSNNVKLEPLFEEVYDNYDK